MKEEANDYLLVSASVYNMDEGHCRRKADEEGTYKKWLPITSSRENEQSEITQQGTVEK